MRSLRQASLSLALTLVPVLGTGCVSLSSPRSNVAAVARRTELKMNSARVEEGRGNLNRAKQIYAEIHKQDPQNAECSHRLAVVCTRLNQHMEAEVYYLQAYAIHPNDSELLSDMGYAAFLQKDYDKSETWLEKSVKLNGNDRRTINNLAIVRGWQVRDEASLATFRVLHSEAEAIRHLAAIQLARGDKERGDKNNDLARRMTSPGVTATVAQETSSQAPATSPQFELPNELPAPSEPLLEAAPHLTVAIVELPPTAAAALMVHVEPSSSSSISQATSQAVVDLPPPLPELPPEPAAIPVLPPPALELPASVESVAVTWKSSDPLTAPVAQRTEIAIERPSELKHRSVPNEATTSAAEPQLATPSNVASVDDNFSFQRISTWQPTPGSGHGQTTQSASIGTSSHSGQQEHASSRRVESPLGEICLVTLFEEKRIVPASPSCVIEYQSQRYQFRSHEALEKFRAAPERYVPAAGGLDVVAVRNERRVVQGSLNYSLWYHRQLYLFSSAEHAETFRKSPQIYVAAK